MPKLVAFLRAINVGGHTVRMADLRKIFSAAGMSNVETFIASGNVIFDSPSRHLRTLEKKIESALEDALDYPVGTFVRTIPDVARVAAYQPFEDSATLFVGFTSDHPDASRLEKLKSDTDDFHAGGSEIYWLRRSADTDMTGGRIEKALGTSATFRNINTVRRIAAKYPVAITSRKA